MANRPTLAKPVCIFCGGGPMSKEHILPKWALPILPSASSHTRYRCHRWRPGDQETVLRRTKRQGSVGTIRLRKVCKSCNSGWMSACEEAIKPELSRMIFGQNVAMPQKSQNRLVEYLTYKFMLLDLESVAIMPAEMVSIFHTDRVMPPIYSIHIFNCRDDVWRSGYHTHGLALGIEPTTPGVEIETNTKSFTLAIGNLFIFALISTVADLNSEFNFDPKASHRLWPPSGTLLSWPAARAIDGEEAEVISRTLQTLSESSSTLTLPRNAISAKRS